MQPGLREQEWIAAPFSFLRPLHGEGRFQLLFSATSTDASLPGATLGVEGLNS